MTYTIKPNELEAISLSASTEQTRYYLNGVYITGNAMVATDGHRLAGLRLSEASSEGFILGNADIKKALQLYKSVPLKQRGDVEIRIVGETLLVINKSENVGSFLFKPVDGNFPDYTRVIPTNTDEGKPVTSFNAAYMADFDKMSRLLTGNKTSCIRLRSTGDDAPLLVDIAGAGEFTGVLMPKRF